MLDEVLKNGNESQKAEARQMLDEFLDLPVQAVNMQNMKEPGSIRSVALPGLGANTGQVPVEICADLMWTGFSLFRRRSFEDFAQMREALEMELGDLKSSLVSNVSHELKTPLALIRLYSETLELGRAPSPEKEKEFLRIIGRESQRLTHLINNVLDLDRIERDQLEESPPRAHELAAADEPLRDQPREGCGHVGVAQSALGHAELGLGSEQP